MSGRDALGSHLIPFSFSEGDSAAAGRAVGERAGAESAPFAWPPAVPPAGSVVHRDLEFARTAQKRLYLNLYVPEDVSQPCPVVVWIHGGGWQGGAPEEGIPLHLVGRGFAVAGITYRFSTEALWPAQIHDCKGAIRWLRAHAAEYGLDPDRVGVAGLSAGGHLAAMLGVTGGDKELEGDTGGNLEYSSRVQAVCPMCCPMDFLAMAREPGKWAFALSYMSALVGGPLEERRAPAEQASPVTHVKGGEPPFLMMYGGADTLIPASEGEALHQALRRVGANSTFRVVKDGWHVLLGPEIDAALSRFFADTLLRR